MLSDLQYKIRRNVDQRVCSARAPVKSCRNMPTTLQQTGSRTLEWPSELRCTRRHNLNISDTPPVDTERAYLVVRHVELLLETRDAGVPNIRTILQ